MRFFAAALIFFGVAASYAQTPEVPHKIHFAGMSLTIRDDARREIQKDVDALTHHSRYFDMKVERARMYFPIIEKIFAEENLPDDFKYLCLQESALVPDAVSVSNAVGFWQFKDFTAQEMGMRVDNEIDERMNIVSASRGAARYLKQNNIQFNNWILALQSYQMGAGGVKRALGDKYNGESHMEISSETYWYVKKYLAHKIAFENAVQGKPALYVSLYETSEKKLSEIANEVAVAEIVLKEYNKWVKRGSIPGDKSYSVLVPTGTAPQDFSNLTMNSGKASKAIPLAKSKNAGYEKTVINGVDAVKAGQGETISTLAARLDVDASRLIAYNDISIDQEIIAGRYYFIGKKKKKSDTYSYKAKVGDDIWSVSQQFGVRLKNLKKLNPDLSDAQISAGTMVRLNPQAKVAEQLMPAEQQSDPGEIAVLSDNTFSWAVQPNPVANVVELKPEESSTKNQVIDTLKMQMALSPSADSLIQHEVVAGETFYSIAQKYSLGVSELVKINNLNIVTPLKLGQLLIIKKPAAKLNTAPTLPEANPDLGVTIYIVKNSDTLYAIARQFGATIKEIMDWNGKTSLTVTAGEKLKIVKK